MFIPYAGFKGDDANSNTVTCAWMDVGSQGDLQTARISTSNYHRERVYVSKVNNWSHLVGSPTVNVNEPFVYDVTQDVDRVSAAGFTFTLTAVNTNGKSVTSVVQIKNPGLKLKSITVTDPHGNFDETDHVHPFKGQQYRLSLDLTVRGTSCVWQGATINTNTNASAHTITNNGNGTFNVHVEYLTNQPAAGRDIEIPLAVMLTVDGEDTYFLKKSGSGIVLENKENKDYQWIIYPVERDATRYINPRD